MLRTASAKIGSAAVTHTQMAIEDELGWVFRAQPTEDFGIDAHAEVVDGEEIHGRLLALQIKGGKSCFKRPAPGGWWFRPEPDNVRYWMTHSLPVVVVLHHPTTNRCHWQLVNQETLVSTGSGWKLLVPERHVLDETARAPLRDAAVGDPATLPHPGGRRFSRRAIVLGGFAALTVASGSTALLWPRTSRPGTTTPTPFRVLTTGSKADQVAFSPRGHTLASSESDGSIRLWDTTTWTPTILNSGGSGWAIAYRPDGGMLAGGDGTSATVKLWDTATRHATTLTGQSGRVFTVAFSPNGDTLASGSPMDTVEVWDVTRRSRVASFFTYVPVYSLAFDGDGGVLALGCGDGTVQLRNLPDGGKAATLSGHTDVVGSVAYGPDWATLASGSNDRTIRLWDPSTGVPLSVLRGHTGWVESIAFSPDGKTLASGSTDFTIRLWDVVTGRTTAVLRGHTGWVESVAFSPDGGTLASAGTDATIRLWRVPT